MYNDSRCLAMLDIGYINGMLLCSFGSWSNVNVLNPTKEKIVVLK